MRRMTRKGGVSGLAGRKRTRVYVLCGLLAVTIVHGQTLEELKTTYNEQVRVLDANYAAQVSAAKEQFKAKVVLLRDHLKKEGDLQAYLAVETELEKLDASTTSDQVASPHVRKLLLRYEKDKNEVDQRLLVLRRKLNLQYQERLKERIKVLMLADRIEDAELAQTELDLILGMTIISSAGVDKVQSFGLTAVRNATYPSVQHLHPGSLAAQHRQRNECARRILPLEVKSAKVGIVLRYVPSGTFLMGSSAEEKHRDPDETMHMVTLTKALYVGKYEITQAQWARVMGINPSHFKGTGGDAPVENVSWEDCQDFLKKLCDIEGVPLGTYRLLTEAEWEYSCRAGTQKPFASPDVAAMAWYGRHAQKPRPVGLKKPNGWGLFDMHGNVAEHCSDWFFDYPRMAVVNPVGPRSGEKRIRRGGNFLGKPDTAERLRSAWRGKTSSGGRGIGIGLRIGVSVP